MENRILIINWKFIPEFKKTFNVQDSQDKIVALNISLREIDSSTIIQENQDILLNSIREHDNEINLICVLLHENTPNFVKEDFIEQIPHESRTNRLQIRLFGGGNSDIHPVYNSPKNPGGLLYLQGKFYPEALVKPIEEGTVKSENFTRVWDHYFDLKKVLDENRNDFDSTFKTAE